jgi:hypothetical protein
MHDPMGEVGEHIEGKRANVHEAVQTGNIHNHTGAMFIKEVVRASGCADVSSVCSN